jgi:hypothetical protein
VQLVTREMLWHLFECTGSIWAYLAYRRLQPLAGVVILTVSLN